MNITIAEARTICKMEEVCWSEGTSPLDAGSLLFRIGAYFPELKQEFAFLPWDKYET